MIRGVWTRATIGWVVAIALLPPAAVLVALQGGQAVSLMLLALVTGLGWQIAFRLSMGVPFSPTPAVMAVALAALGPDGLVGWQVVLGVSFGLVVAELIFGGWGRNVISAPVTALAFLYLSFPALPVPEPTAALTLAAILSGAILVATGIASWRVILATAAAYVAVLEGVGVDSTLIWTGGAFAFGLVFLVADPVASAATNRGRWAYGALAGGLAALLAWAGPAGPLAPQPIIFAALLAQVFAPLIDHAAIAGVYARSKRHG